MAGQKKKKGGKQGRRVDDKVKREAVRRLAAGESGTVIANDLGFASSAVYGWSRDPRWQSNGPGSTERYFTTGQKQSAAREFLAGGSAHEIARRVGCSPRAVAKWAEDPRYRPATNGSAGIPQIAKPRRKRVKAKSTKKKQVGLSILDRIETLEAAVDDLRWQLGLD